MSDDLASTLRDLEYRLMNSAIRRDRAELESRLAEDFVEFGGSGRIFDREAIIAELTHEAPLPERRIEDLIVVFQTSNEALIRYRCSGLSADGSGQTVASLRSSFWVRQGGQWRIRFHQGTRCAATTPSV